jgi:hypothetical protein
VPRITEQKRQEIRDLHAQGLPRNEIARRAGVSNDSVSKICAAAGLTFDRTATETATKAKQADNKQRRADITSRLYGRVESILTRLESDTYRYVVTLKDTTEVIEDTEPPADVERNHATAIGIYLDKVTKLEALDNDNGVESAKNMIANLAGQLGINDA